MARRKTVQIGTPHIGGESSISGGTRQIGHDHSETKTLRTFRLLAIEALYKRLRTEGRMSKLALLYYRNGTPTRWMVD